MLKAIITKTDLAYVAKFDSIAAHRIIPPACPGMKIFALSAKTGENMVGWLRCSQDRRSEPRRDLAIAHIQPENSGVPR